jgi:two-component system NarL family sensor kinase
MHAQFPKLVLVGQPLLPGWPQQRPTPVPYIGLVLNSLGVGYFSVDRRYDITDANTPALKWLNMAREDVVGRPFSAIVPQSPMKMLKAAVEQKVFVDRQLNSYQRPDRLLDLHVYPTNDGAIIFFQDVTEHDLQRQDAIRAQILLQSSLDASPAQVVVLDETGAIISCNAAWQQFAHDQGLSASGGARPLNYLALYSKPFVRSKDALKIGTTLTSLLRGERRTAHLLHSWPIKGSIRWFQLNAARFECWGKTYLAVANEDVTAVKDAQRASEEMAERLRTIQEEERQRIAKELHDSTAQHLVAIGLSFMKLKSRLRYKKRQSALFKEIETSLQEASKELRTFTYLLHPPKLDDDGFRDTAERYALGFGNRAGLSVSLRIASILDTAPFELQRCFFRIVQEALTNVHRHASASKVCIELRHLHQHLHLIVRDNGLGIDDAGRSVQRTSQFPMGVGIPGMQERLRHFGGELVIRSGPGGTRVHAIVPFDARLHKSSSQRPSVRLPTTSGKLRAILPPQA